MKALTPAMRQYAEIKKRHGDSILFFRMGDFYETFWDDAGTASRELDIVLTSRSTDDASGKIPMAGVPYHSVEPYIARLVRKGYKVAICEQLEDPRSAKGIVKRDVVRVITPGTAVDDYLLDSRSNNYLAAVVKEGTAFGVAFADVSTGDFFTTQFPEGEGAGQGSLAGELARFRPAECILPAALFGSGEVQAIAGQPGTTFYAFDTPLFSSTERADELLRSHFGVVSMEAFGLGERELALRASAGVIGYLRETQKASLEHMNRLTAYSSGSFMVLDQTTLRNLEILANVRDGTSKGTLLSVLDGTRTPMGSRTLRKWLLQPLLDNGQIDRRLDAVAEVHGSPTMRGELHGLLGRMADLERLASRAVYGSASPRDLLALRNSLRLIPELKTSLRGPGAAERSEALRSICADLSDMDEVVRLIDSALVDEPPANVRDGGVVREGYSAELDALRRSSNEGKRWIAQLEEVERRATGIRSLKVGYNQVFGYYLEVTRPHLPKVPASYERRQTLSNCERFVTPELREKETVVLDAEEKLAALETELFKDLLRKVAKEIAPIQGTARAVADLDCIHSFASVAASNGYVRPELRDDDAITIKDGRHPVVERSGTAFVPNDAYLDNGEDQLIILTGPNMAGKSTYMRQVALIVLMARVGSFVPAKYASIGRVDRIFTRVGAFDDLTSGQSTFMVEMLELANILNGCTPRSLVVLDEIGRGTSTFDGLSIAWAVAEYLHGLGKRGAKTMLATHYHQLTELTSSLKRSKNYHIAVKEEKDEIIFLRKVVPGATDRSYGIQVAKLAGLPRTVIERAKEILAQMEAQDLAVGGENGKRPGTGKTARPRYTQLLIFGSGEGAGQGAGQGAGHEVLRELGELEVERMTPVEALQKLDELRRKAKGA